MIEVSSHAMKKRHQMVGPDDAEHGSGEHRHQAGQGGPDPERCVEKYPIAYTHTSAPMPDTSRVITSAIASKRRCRSRSEGTDPADRLADRFTGRRPGLGIGDGGFTDDS